MSDKKYFYFSEGSQDKQTKTPAGILYGSVNLLSGRLEGTLSIRIGFGERFPNIRSETVSISPFVWIEISSKEMAKSLISELKEFYPEEGNVPMLKNMEEVIMESFQEDADEDVE